MNGENLGKVAVVNMHEMNGKADFYKHPSLPLESAFDPDWMKVADCVEKNEGNFKKLLKPEEDVDKDGNTGMFFMRPGFGMAFVTNIEDEVMDDEVVTEVMANIPHIDKWVKIYVTK